jgi:hypothetical protein
MFDGLFDDGAETVYGHGRSFDAAAEQAYDALPEEGHVEVLDDEGIDLGSRERYGSSDEVVMDAEADAGYELKVVTVRYRHEPSVDPDVGPDDGGYHPLDELDGLRHPNDELSGLGHPLDRGFPS